MEDIYPGLGRMIRACRLRYYLSRRLGCFIRISGGHNGQPFLVELMPTDDLMKERFRKDETNYYVLYQLSGQDAEAIIDGIKPLKGVIRVKKRIEFYINDLGELVKQHWT